MRTQVLGASHRRRIPYAVPVSGGGDNWWEAGGASGVLAAYQAKGAASLADSYTDLSGNGNDAALGVAPGWDSSTGWSFTGSQYLRTVVPAIDYTVIVGFSDRLFTAGRRVFGVQDIGTGYILQLYHDASPRVQFYHSPGTLYQENGSFAAGVEAIAGKEVYRDGASLGSMGSGSATTSYELYIGGRNLNGSFSGGGSCKIYAFAVYDNELSASAIADVTTAMEAL